MRKGIVIGGTKGLGKSIFESFPATYNVVSLSRTSQPISLDLKSDSETIQKTIKQVIDHLHGIDFLIISSGMGAYLKFPELTNQDKIDELFKVNVFGPIQAYAAARKSLIKSKGKCIFITSSVAEHGARGLSVYAATKGAINSFVKSEARTAAKLGYAICAVAPGWFESDMTKDINPELKKSIVKFIPEKRMGKVEEISDFVLSILSSSNWTVQGQVFNITGGY